MKKAMKDRLIASAAFCMTLALLVFPAHASSAGWNRPLSRGDFHAHPQSTIPPEDNETLDLAADADTVGPVAEASSVPKLFWLECGPTNNCRNASLYYVDPAAATPVRTLFEAGVLVSEDPRPHGLALASFNLATFQLSNLRTAYIVYFKGGKIWYVDTTTLVKTQASSESGVTASQLCRFASFPNVTSPGNSLLYYELAGSDGSCGSGDDRRRAVRLNMSATTAPTALGGKSVAERLFDGRYLVKDWTAPPYKLKACQANLTTCMDIASFSSDVNTGDYDASRIVLIIDGVLKIFNSGSNTMTTLYTPTANEFVSSFQLDRNGYVYFSTVKRTSPYVNAIRRAPVGGGTATALASFTLTYGLSFLDVQIAPSHVVYSYPNAGFSAQVVRSIPKAGGSSITLESAGVSGGVVGGHAYFEDTSGRVKRVGLDGTGLVTKSGSQISGVSLGGSMDWHYGLNPSTSRAIITSSNGTVKSYRLVDDISDPASGMAIGTMPVNLSNLDIAGYGNAMIGTAGKRDLDCSFGQDVLYLNAAKATSLRRMTNTNGVKETTEQVR